MKRFLIALIIFPFAAYSQITLTSQDFGDAGDTAVMSTTTDMGIDFATTGANQTWDYSGLVAESQHLVEYYDMSNLSFLVSVVYGAFAATDYQASYYMPNSDLPLDQVGSFLPVPIDNIFQFSKKTADSITSVGFALDVDGNEVPFKSDTIETRYKFPLNYNDIYSSKGYTEMDMNPIADFNWVQSRERNSVVDGWGSITTPYGTFDALRIKHIISEVDSVRMDVFGNMMWIPIPIPDSYIYEWWTNGETEAILRIETNDVFGNEVVSNIEYKDFYLGIAQVDETELDVRVYPNPASEVLLVKGVSQKSKYQIIDVMGKEVLSGDMNGLIDIHELTPGSYRLMVLDGSTQGLVGFIKH
jgi:hypothetical protein